MDVIGFVKKDYLLVISAVLALISLFLVPFDTIRTYSYNRILETICTLLIFLLIVAGLKECNALNKLAHKAVTNIRTTRTLCLALILLPFFCAMLFSNDVALLTFVPLSITMLTMAGLKGTIIIVVVLQTVAANVGSYLTPFGNPHNLYIFNFMDHYGFTLWEYEATLIPIVVVGAIVLIAIAMMIKNKPLTAELEEDIELKDRKILIAICILFVIAIVTVLDLIPFYITLAVIVLAFLVMMPRVFKKVNYSILFIFFFLFLFANGLTNMSEVHSLITDLMEWDPMLTTVLVSQFTSNVPSTILLQPFTDDWAAVLVGADIGGFGTPIASMASIISIKLYLQEEDSSIKQYLKVFFAVNLVMLVVLIPTYYIFCV
ncbi:MAG: hypothetical protein IKQ93_00595 [Candidatus Methanomethylophilaceae archaeon]|nr:hypothetical protein [Candidatus Methanomethylophilaceae archaeon]